MKDSVKCGFPAPEFRAFAHWEGEVPCVLGNADSLQAFRLHLLDKERCIVLLQDIFAARMFCLFDQRRRNRRDDTFNCFMAVDALLNGRIPIDSVSERPAKGEPHSVDDIPLAEPPYGFQLHGPYAAFAPNGTIIMKHGAIHEGVVIAHDERSHPIVFQKNGSCRPHVTEWENVIASYPKTQSVSIFDLPPT